MMLPFFLPYLLALLMLRGTETFISLPISLLTPPNLPTYIIHACLCSLLASSDPVPFTLLVAGDCFAFWVPSSK
jgi:hypothetical protein